MFKINSLTYFGHAFPIAQIFIKTVPLFVSYLFTMFLTHAVPLTLLSNTLTMQGLHGESHAPAPTDAHYYLRAETDQPVAGSFAYPTLLTHTYCAINDTR